MAIARVIVAVSNLAVLGSAGQINPDYATNITVYHLNPASAGENPVNMDTGDKMGDLNFFLPEFFLPLACADPDSRAKFDCDNAERTDPNLVVTKVEMEVDSQYTGYSACNLCETGVDPVSRHSCVNGTYVCDCFDRQATCDPKKVGKEQASGHYHCYSGYSKSWDCWGANIDAQVTGLWYSHLAEGECKTNTAESNCGWRVNSMETVTEQCMKERLMTAVEHAGPDCFSSCGPRNETSSCWINCFFSTLLGSDSNSTMVDSTHGMHVDDVAAAWDAAFQPADQGGCPRVQFGRTVIV